MSFYDYEAVRTAARGNWLFVLASLAPQLEMAIQKVGRHVPCPVKGGRDGFRLFRDAHETGGGVSNQSGTFHDGFALLAWLYGWTFHECVEKVAERLGIESEKRPRHSVKNGHVRDLVQPSPEELKSANKYLGTLKSFGAAPYNDDPKNDKSYFVTLRYNSGVTRTFWSVDLERAVAASGVQVGEHVMLAHLGRVPVTLTVDKRAEGGQVVSHGVIQTFRNTWYVERTGRAGDQVKELIDRQVTKAASVVAGSVSSGAEAVIAKAEADNRVIEPPVVQKAAQPLVVQPKPWVLEAQERAKANLERERKIRVLAGEKVRQTWDECVQFPSEHAEPMRRYLLSREILFRMRDADGQDSLRFHPALPYYGEDGKLLRKCPAIVCAIRDVEGQLITLHRTYLTSTGKKAAVEMPRKMMSVPEGADVVGGAIQLGVPKGVLGLAEGLETALSAYKATQIPTWSTVSARLMESVEIPTGVHTVLIWADKDKSITGERSARVLQNRLIRAGLKAHVLLPHMPRRGNAKSVDWNDVLCTQGLLGFPSVKHFV